MQRYFVLEKELRKGLIIKIEDSDFHHIKDVMRMKENDQVIICNDELTFNAHIMTFNKNDVLIELDDEIYISNELKIKVDIAQGLTTREKREEVIQKITQLGATTYIPVKMAKCLVKENNNSLKQLIRLNKIAKEASEQSQRDRKLKVLEPISFKELINSKKNYDYCFYATLLENSTIDNLGKAIKSLNNHKILVVVGPEAGFNNLEEEEMKKQGFIPISLGKRTLRTEVAPVYIMSVISYLMEFGG